MENLPEKSYTNEFNVNLDIFEGPLDLLLELARTQKVDLLKISVLKLANQYLEYIKFIKNINLETASDYLVMAAFLTYLKSKILLPKDSESEEPTAEDLEDALKFQLKRLEKMQDVSKKLFNLSQIGIDTFYRGFNDGVKFKYKIYYTSSLYDLLRAYSMQQNRLEKNSLKIETSALYTVEQSMMRLKNIFGEIIDWIEFNKLIPSLGKNFLINKSAISSTLVASLELVRNGFIQIKQNTPYGPIYLKINNEK